LQTPQQVPRQQGECNIGKGGHGWAELVTAVNERKTNSLPEKMWKFISASAFQHVPWMLGFHDLDSGVHETKLKMALSPKETFVAMMRTQTVVLIQPVVIRNRVTPKDVLLQITAMMMNVPAVSMIGTRGSRFSGGMSQECRPKPYLETATVQQEQLTTRHI
jgi:hypothetical protein